MFFTIGLQRWPISFKTHCELLVSENVNWALIHASYTLSKFFCNHTIDFRYFIKSRILI